jgi:hypothetical protein
MLQEEIANSAPQTVDHVMPKIIAYHALKAIIYGKAIVLLVLVASLSIMDNAFLVQQIVLHALIQIPAQVAVLIII